jgi:S-adenosylmethionine synthetase
VVPVEQIAVEGARAWLRRHLHAVDPTRHVRIHCLVRPGSMDLKELFTRRREGALALANDTSIGVGYAPSSPLEALALGLEQRLNSAGFIAEHPSHGEDVKVMAVRRDGSLSLTLARAFVAAHLPSIDDYWAQTRVVAAEAVRAAEASWSSAEVNVNAADAPDGSSVYLTVTGTSAESGDDGEVGRGNRANGLITPGRPMSLEALCGKNPVSHVGKLYNIVARAIAERVVEELRVEYAECYLVSQIGAPIDQPKLAHVLVKGDRDVAELARPVEDLVRHALEGLPELPARILEGSVMLF